MRLVSCKETRPNSHDEDGAYHKETVHELQDKEHIMVKNKEGVCKYKKGEWTVCDQTFMVSLNHK